MKPSPPSAKGGGGVRSHNLKKVKPHILDGDVRALPHVPSKPRVEVELDEPLSRKPITFGPLAQGPMLTLASMPAASQNFAGMSRNSSCGGTACGAGIPPDPNGDVGLHHFIQAVNSSFAIYNKSGALLASFTENSLWAGSGQPQCDGNSQGDPVVLYDPMADRWILTNMAFPISNGNPVSPFYECIAVSKTSDPVSGGWYLYAVRTDTGGSGQPPVGTLNDYPKFGIWTDCLYFSTNGFQMPNGSYTGGEFGSFSRSDMYAGRPVTGSLGFEAGSNDFFTMIPSNLERAGYGRIAAIRHAELLRSGIPHPVQLQGPQVHQRTELRRRHARGSHDRIPGELFGAGLEHRAAALSRHLVQQS